LALIQTWKSLISDTVPINNNEKLLTEVTIEDVLKHFGKSLKVARRNYHRFVEKGIKHGRREDLQGGGLIRGSGGEKANGIHIKINSLKFIR